MGKNGWGCSEPRQEAGAAPDTLQGARGICHLSAVGLRGRGDYGLRLHWGLGTRRESSSQPVALYPCCQSTSPASLPPAGDGGGQASPIFGSHCVFVLDSLCPLMVCPRPVPQSCSEVQEVNKIGKAMFCCTLLACSVLAERQGSCLCDLGRTGEKGDLYSGDRRGAERRRCETQDTRMGRDGIWR